MGGSRGDKTGGAHAGSGRMDLPEAALRERRLGSTACEAEASLTGSRPEMPNEGPANGAQVERSICLHLLTTDASRFYDELFWGKLSTFYHG